MRSNLKNVNKSYESYYCAFKKSKTKKAKVFTKPVGGNIVEILKVADFYHINWFLRTRQITAKTLGKYYQKNVRC